jgi:hypothetical protein
MEYRRGGLGGMIPFPADLIDSNSSKTRMTSAEKYQIAKGHLKPWRAVESFNSLLACI